jgi:dipeptidyl-peptidase-4
MLRKLKSVAILFVVYILFVLPALAQQLNWTKDGKAYYAIEKNQIVRKEMPDEKETVLVGKDLLKTPENKTLLIRDFAMSEDQTKVLIYTNSQQVWRLDTEGDYWVLDLATKKLVQAGPERPASSLRFAKLSPDAKKVAYVSEYNLYVWDINTGKETAVTTDGNRRLINGTFDWVYEEEFACRDGFQWSPDSKRIAYWQVDARDTRDFYMINNTDSIYSQIVPVEYPKVGESPSAVRIGVVELVSNKTTWLDITGDPRQHYLPRMEWNSATDLFVQQLNRKQNLSKIYSCNVITNKTTTILTEADDAWIDVGSQWEDKYDITFRHKFIWINNNDEFLWESEIDGWRHLYRVSKNGTTKQVTKGNFDVINLLCVDEKNNLVYFHASPENATQKYLYKTKLDGTGKAERVTPEGMNGTNDYSVSPNGTYALRSFQNTFTRPLTEMITLPNHKPINEKESILSVLSVRKVKSNLQFFKVKIDGNTELDGWVVKPENFDPSKKYPVVFYVYSEPAAAMVTDTYGVGSNQLYKGNMTNEGYLYVCIDNRGTPAPKGSAWRKSIYRKIGLLNINDQAKAAKEILKWDYVDPDRVAVWGWSGGGSATLNLLFRYPEIYKTGIAIAAVANQLTYDNIYQERYMGLPQENMEDFIAGSPVTHAKNLQGNLLYIHGTGDDNVHYANADMLINELVKHNKQFQLMAYPNRTHSLSEGPGTLLHLVTLYTEYLRKHCPPGGR